MEYHVSKQGNDQYVGTDRQPFLTISRAAAMAMPGDTITVHAGTYREWVSPANGGTEEKRIVYRSAGDGEVIISGAEQVEDWREEGDNVLEYRGGQYNLYYPKSIQRRVIRGLGI